MKIGTENEGSKWKTGMREDQVYQLRGVRHVVTPHKVTPVNSGSYTFRKAWEEA